MQVFIFCVLEIKQFSFYLGWKFRVVHFWTWEEVIINRVISSFVSEGHKYSIPSTTVWGTSPVHTAIRPPPSRRRGLNDHGETLRTVHSRSPPVRLYTQGKCFSNGVPATQDTVVFTESLFLLPAEDQLPSPQPPPFHPTPHAGHRLDPWNLPCSLLCVVGEFTLPCHREHLFPNWSSNWLLIGLWVRTGDSSPESCGQRQRGLRRVWPGMPLFIPVENAGRRRLSWNRLLEIPYFQTANQA